MELVNLFYIIDEFCKEFEPKWKAQRISSGQCKRIRHSRLSLSEILTIMIHFHQSDHRTFKHYYKDYVQLHLGSEFPNLVSYSRFVEIMSEMTVPIATLLISLLSDPSSANYIDSTKLVVCHNRRIRRNKVFRHIAERGKSSMGWFYGFKLHLIVNEHGQIVSFFLTPGNTPDNNIKAVVKLTRRMVGKLFGDRGYISSGLFTALWDKGFNSSLGLERT